MIDTLSRNALAESASARVRAALEKLSAGNRLLLDVAATLDRLALESRRDQERADYVALAGTIRFGLDWLPSVEDRLKGQEGE